MAHLPAVVDQVHVEGIDELWRQPLLQVRVGLLGGGARRDQPETAGDAIDVSVHGERRPAQSEAENAGRCLGAYARQAEEPGFSLVQGEIAQE